MANHLELRKVIVKANTENGTAERETWEYRTKDVVISILGVSLGAWSPWTRIESEVVWQTPEGGPL